jgi:hypothetical protein
LAWIPSVHAMEGTSIAAFFEIDTIAFSITLWSKILHNCLKWLELPWHCMPTIQALRSSSISTDKIGGGPGLFASILSLFFFAKRVMVLSGTLGNAVHTALGFIPSRYFSTASSKSSWLLTFFFRVILWNRPKTGDYKICPIKIVYFFYSSHYWLDLIVGQNWCTAINCDSTLQSFWLQTWNDKVISFSHFVKSSA